MRPACPVSAHALPHTIPSFRTHVRDPRRVSPLPRVAIARTGPQPYAADEVADDVEGFSDVVVMLRDEDEVFDSEAMASFEGKPLVIDHPDEDVNPDNWKELAVGHVQNVRRGEGTDDDLLIADILVTDAEAIRLIRKEGLRERRAGMTRETRPSVPAWDGKPTSAATTSRSSLTGVAGHGAASTTGRGQWQRNRAGGTASWATPR